MFSDAGCCFLFVSASATLTGDVEVLVVFKMRVDILKILSYSKFDHNTIEKEIEKFKCSKSA